MITPTLISMLLAAAVKATVILGVAAVADVALLRRRTSASVRHIVWTVAIVGTLAAPAFMAMLPPLNVPVLRADVPTPEAPASVASTLIAPRSASETAQLQRDEPKLIATVPGNSVGVPVEQAAGENTHGRANFVSGLVAIYVVVALAILVGILVDHVIVWRIARRSTVVDDAPWLSLLRTLARRSRIRRPVELVWTADPVMPLTTGVVRPRIVIPVAARAWSTELRESVLLHELAHVGRRDCLTQLLAAIACAVYWPNPLVWLAASRLRVERELACDDLVLSRGIEAHDYAAHLLEIARGLYTPRLAVSMAAASGLETRIRALIDETRHRHGPGSRWVIAATTLALGFVALLSAARPGRATAVPYDAVEPAKAAAAPVLAPVVVHPAVTAISLTAPAPAVPAAPAQQRPVERGEFSVRLAAPGDGPRNAGRIHVMLQTPGLNTFYERPDRLEGLSPNQLMLSGTPLEFRLRRDAGTFRFSGVARDGRGSGRFEFTHDPAFADSLARRGIRAPSAREQYNFARHDVSLAYIDALLKEGYAVPTPGQLDRAGMSSVDIDFVRDMAALGYRVGTVDALVGMANRGVSPDQIRALAAAGYRNLTVSELVALDDQDIDSTFIRDANTRAGRQLSVRELLARRLGAESSTALAPPPARGEPERERRDAPVFDDTVSTGRWTLVSRSDGWLQLDIEWANVNQWRRFVRPADLVGITGFGTVGPTPVAFRIERDAGTFSFEGVVERGRGAGVFSFAPNRAFAETLRAAGVREAEVVGVHSLKNLAFGFIDAVSVREFMAAGLSPLTLDDLLSLAVRQVTPGYLRDLESLGVRGLDSVDGIVEVRFASVPVAYARELNALGYNQLTYRDLIELYRAGVSADFIRQQQRSGRALTPDELIDLRRGRR